MTSCRTSRLSESLGLFDCAPVCVNMQFASGRLLSTRPTVSLRLSSQPGWAQLSSSQPAGAVRWQAATPRRRTAAGAGRQQLATAAGGGGGPPPPSPQQTANEDPVRGPSSSELYFHGQSIPI